MAREATITGEQVRAAADGILAAGGKPTARAVRERLGRGSMATVLRLFQQWQADNPRTIKAADLPPDIALVLTRHINTEIGLAKARLEERIDELESACADLIAECERGQDELADTMGERDRALQDKAKVEGELARAEAENARLAEEARESLAGAESARTELAKALLRLEALPRLESENARLTEQVESMRVRAEEAERRAAVFEARLGAEQAAHERARKDADERRSEMAGLEAAIGAGKRMTARRRERQAHW